MLQLRLRRKGQDAKIQLAQSEEPLILALVLSSEKFHTNAGYIGITCLGGADGTAGAYASLAGSKCVNNR